MESLNWIRIKYSNIILLIEKHEEKIPLSKLILLYLRIPIVLRIILTFLIFGFSHKLAYIIGFIILQSKSRNEVLSLITAFQNPIHFDDRLYFYYAFVYLFITLITILPFGLCLFYGRILLKTLKFNKLYFGIGILVWMLFITFLSFVLLQFAPLIPYYMFYASKNSSFWEIFINYFLYSKEIHWYTPSFDLKIFQKEVFISLQSGNMVVVLLIFLFLTYRKNYKTREQDHNSLLKLAVFESQMILYLQSKWEALKINSLIMHFKLKKSTSFVLYILSIYAFCFAILIVFISHTAYQLGGFGKNLSQFDTDYVVVEYSLNGRIKNVEGVRIHQDKNYIVIRDKQNNIHSIFTDQIHVQAEQLPSN